MIETRTLPLQPRESSSTDIESMVFDFFWQGWMFATPRRTHTCWTLGLLLSLPSALVICSCPFLNMIEWSLVLQVTFQFLRLFPTSCTDPPRKSSELLLYHRYQLWEMHWTKVVCRAAIIFALANMLDALRQVWSYPITAHPLMYWVRYLPVYFLLHSMFVRTLIDGSITYCSSVKICTINNIGAKGIMWVSIVKLESERLEDVWYNLWVIMPHYHPRNCKTGQFLSC